MHRLHGTQQAERLVDEVGAEVEQGPAARPSGAVSGAYRSNLDSNLRTSPSEPS